MQFQSILPEQLILGVNDLLQDTRDQFRKIKRSSWPVKCVFVATKTKHGL